MELEPSNYDDLVDEDEEKDDEEEEEEVETEDSELRKRCVWEGMWGPERLCV